MPEGLFWLQYGAVHMPAQKGLPSETRSAHTSSPVADWP
jgi:hypothetical protein